MLEAYYVRPDTIDRIRASWIGKGIEDYVSWLRERKYSDRSVLRRIPILIRFGEFAQSRGATQWEHLPDHVEPFVCSWITERGKHKASAVLRKKFGPVRSQPDSTDAAVARAWLFRTGTSSPAREPVRELCSSVLRVLARREGAERKND